MSQSEPESNNGPSEEQMRDLHENLDAATRKIGLHLQSLEVAGTPDDDHLPEQLKGKLIATGLFMVGDLAFSDEVQNPEAAKMKEEFRDIVPNINDTFLDIREQLKREAEEGFFDEP